MDHDQLAYRYEVLGILGKGSFGQVLKCSDHKYKVMRAVKMIRNKRRFHQQALVEVKILEHLRDKVLHSSRTLTKALLWLGIKIRSGNKSLDFSDDAVLIRTFPQELPYLNEI